MAASGPGLLAFPGKRIVPAGRAYTYNSKYANVDWGRNDVRAERIDRLIRKSKLKRIDIGAHMGLSPFFMSQMLRSRTVPVTEDLEKRFRETVDLLMRRNRQRTDRSATQKASSDNASRIERINRIIKTSKLKRHEIARLAGITPFHLSRVLANMRSPLMPDVESRVEQAVDQLLKQARSEVDRQSRFTDPSKQ